MGVKRRSGTAQGASSHPAKAATVRVELHVRPGATTTAVGGSHDGALTVKVTAPAVEGRATAAALRAVAEALEIAPSSLTVLRGATTRRKLVEISIPSGAEDEVRHRLARLREP